MQRTFTKTIRSIFFTIIGIISLFFNACKSKSGTENYIGNLSEENPEISILNWRVIGPFTYSVLDSTDSTETHLFRLMDTVVNQRQGHFIDLGELLRFEKRGVAYATCEIITDRSGDVAFLMGGDNNIRLRVNNELKFQQRGNTALHKNGIVERIHLKKGINKVMVEIRNSSKAWKFYLNVATIEHVRTNALIRGYYNSIVNATIAKGDSLRLKVSNPGFIPIQNKSLLKVYDINGILVLKQSIDLKKKNKVPLKGLKESVYRYELYTDIDTLDGMFSYGDINRIYKDSKLDKVAAIDKDLYNNYIAYSKRLDYILNLKRKRDTEISMKIAFCLYRMLDIKNKYSKSDPSYLAGTGLQIKSFPSKIDNRNEYYQLYIPKSYGKGIKKMPLVVMVPYVVTKHEFYNGGIVANAGRTEYISKFAERFGFAVLWAGARVYERYNLTPLITKSIDETIAEVSKHYKIDDRSIYLYGDCSGGLFTLLTAVRQPDKFAAIGIEGPELTAVDFPNINVSSTSAEIGNNIFSLTENLSLIPTLVLHSKYDNKAPIDLSLRFMDSLKTNGGEVVYDDLRDASKGEYNGTVKMMSEPEAMLKVFKFFDSHRTRERTNSIKFSTYGIYPDTVYGISIDQKIGPGKATIDFSLLDQKTIDISSVNVRHLTVDLKKLSIPNVNREFRIIHNNKFLSTAKLSGLDSKMKINIPMEDNTMKENEPSSFVGPINKLFLDRFAVVRPQKSREYIQKALVTLDSLWRFEYLTNIPIVDELSLTSQGNTGTGHIYLVDGLEAIDKDVLSAAGIELNDLGIKVKGKRINGKDISFAFLSRKDCNNKYDLFIGSNTGSISESMLESVIQEGWYDIELWDNTFNQPILRNKY